MIFRRRIAIFTVAILALAVGGLILVTRAATNEVALRKLPTPSPSPLPSPSPVESPTPSPEPSPSPPPQLELSGILSGSQPGVATGPCGVQAAGYYLQVIFSSSATRYQLTATIAPYGGPGRYSAPPAKVSLKPVGVQPPVLYTGVRGTFTINPDGRSGSLKEDLQSQTASISVNGTWQCP